MLRPVIDRTLPFEVTTANIVEQGRTRAGKVVVTMATPHLSTSDDWRLSATDGVPWAVLLERCRAQQAGLTATVSSVRRQRRPVVA